MYDVHCHLIFGEDDGSRSLEESIDMVKIYMDNGYKGAILTSHYDRGRYKVSSDRLIPKYELLKNRIEEEGLDFKIFPGNEIQIDETSVDLLKKGEVLSLNKSSYVLCELPFSSKPFYAKEVFYQMQLEGWTPIIAHVERYPYVENNLDWIKDFINTGVLTQLNLSSLSSARSKDLAIKLLQSNMVHMVGTDSHQSEWRSPKVKEDLEILKDLVGEDKFIELTSTNPLKVIKDEYIPNGYDEIVDLSKNRKKRWFEFWR